MEFATNIFPSKVCWVKIHFKGFPYYALVMNSKEVVLCSILFVAVGDKRLISNPFFATKIFFKYVEYRNDPTSLFQEHLHALKLILLSLLIKRLQWGCFPDQICSCIHAIPQYKFFRNLTFYLCQREHLFECAKNRMCQMFSPRWDFMSIALSFLPPLLSDCIKIFFFAWYKRIIKMSVSSATTVTCVFS